MLLTAARRSEAADATWSEFDLEKGLWTIPAIRRKDTRSGAKKKQKRKLALEVPLSPQAVDLLVEVRAAEIQRRQLLKIDEPILPTTKVFTGIRGGNLVNWDRWLKRVSPRACVTNWSAHDLRRTAATMIGELGYAPHIVSVVLGHSNIGGQLVADYNKSFYFNDHKSALKSLGDKIGKINN